MDDSLNICLACGLCCDGTLIGFVQLEPKELTNVSKVMDIEVTNGNGIFMQPCDKYCDGCTIYSDRPKQCASFKCHLLNAVEQKELDFNSAVEMIDAVKQKKASIEQKLAVLEIELKSESFYFKMVELIKWLKNIKPELSLTQNYQELITDLKQLDSMLSQRFGVSLY